MVVWAMTIKELASKMNEYNRQGKGDCLVYVQVEQLNKGVSYPVSSIGFNADSGPNIIIIKG